MVSKGFQPPTALPVVLLDADTLVPVRLDDTTLSVRLPDLPGTHDLWILAPTVVRIPEQIHLNGFMSAEQGPVFQGRTQPGAHPTEIYGSGVSTVRLWNVSTGATIDYPEFPVASCTRGVGPGLKPGELTVLDLAGSWCGYNNQSKRLVLEPGLTALDSAPITTNRFVAPISLGHWVVPGPHQFYTTACDSGVCSFVAWVRGESGFDVVLSPRGDRAALVAYVFDSSGAPVLDAATAAVSYVVPPLQSVSAALFTENGDTLLLAGQDDALGHVPSSRLMVVRAGDGVVLGSLTFGGIPCGLALDETRPWLYVAARDYLYVLDRRDLTEIARLGHSFFSSTYCRILPSPLERRVYVVETEDVEFYSGAHAWLTRFETPPQ